MPVISYFSGAIEQWGLTLPTLSRGRYISKRAIRRYEMDLFSMRSAGKTIHRCLFFYSDTPVTGTLDILPVVPNTRTEQLLIAIDTSGVGFFVPFLINEEDTPTTAGTFGSSINISLSANQAQAFWLKFITPEGASPTDSAYFTLRWNANPISYIHYSVGNKLPKLYLDLWQGIRAGAVDSPSVAGSDDIVTPSQPGRYLRSSWSSPLLVYHPLTVNFAESNALVRDIYVHLLAIAETWLRADALVRVTDIEAFRQADALVFIADLVQARADALLHISPYTPAMQRADAMIILASAIIQRLADALVNFASTEVTTRADGLTHFGIERFIRGDAFFIFATRGLELRADGKFNFLSYDDILEIPDTGDFAWMMLFLPPLREVIIKSPFSAADTYWTETIGDPTLVRVFSSNTSQGPWQLFLTVSTYPTIDYKILSSGWVKVRNERSWWATIILAFRVSV